MYLGWYVCMYVCMYRNVPTTARCPVMTPPRPRPAGQLNVIYSVKKGKNPPPKHLEN